MRSGKENRIRKSIKHLIEIMPELRTAIDYTNNKLSINISDPLYLRILGISYSMLYLAAPLVFFGLRLSIYIIIPVALLYYYVTRFKIISPFFYRNSIVINFDDNSAVFKNNIFESRISFDDYSSIVTRNTSRRIAGGIEMYFLRTKGKKMIYLGEFAENKGGSQFKNLIRTCFEVE